MHHAQLHFLLFDNEKEPEIVGRKRKSIPSAVEAEVLASSRRRCCVCSGLRGDLAEKKGQIAHLDHDPSSNDIDNLAFMCFDDHDQYDSQTSQSKNLTITEVRRYRSELYERWKSEPAGAGRERPVEGPRPLVPAPAVPEDVSASVRLLAAEYRVPGPEDMVSAWGEHYDPQTGFPVLCTGSFTGRIALEYALFILGVRNVKYRVVVLTENARGEPELFELDRGDGYPRDRFIRRLDPGSFPVSRAVWKHGGPKTLHLRVPGVELGTFESAACVYYWDEASQSFVAQWISD